jgi:glycosyltransferase involved in cell wall biosynthesis
MAATGNIGIDTVSTERMRLTILNVSYPLACVSQDTAGGAEQILGTLDEALVDAGHRSIVLAPEGSRCCGMLVPTRRYASSLDDAVQEEAREHHRCALERALQRYPVDVVHLHGVDFLDYLPSPGVPVVVTLHLPPDWYPPELFRIDRPDTYLVCVSQSQKKSCPAHARVAAVIENGVPVEKFSPSAIKKNYVAALGRICPEKGFHLAMDAAARSGTACFLAGSLYDYPAHRKYFEKEIGPRLANGHHFTGPLCSAEKNKLLAEARCVLAPSLVAETSSLVAMEAMACGTPVVAFRKGALCEIVSNERTGYLVDSVEDMAEAISWADRCSPAQCRSEAETRFSAERMCEQYLELYESVSGPCRNETACEVRT